MKPSSSVNMASDRCPNCTNNTHGEWRYTDNATRCRTGPETRNLACLEEIQTGEVLSVRIAVDLRDTA